MTAQVITDDAEAVAAASAPSNEFRAGASAPDTERWLPRYELDRLSAPAPTNVP
ncbi:hypothetical protein ACIRQQ_39565 [Streptomyces fuscichromogenes]|uniref:hypothetical protein n=1 Tax=Streptomyces fuscichromogenes TaxID=1324013 RepID=UPI0038144533